MNRKTALISAAAVAGTLLVGTGAIAANIAVLNSADGDAIGNLSAEMPVPTAAVEPQIIDVYVEDPAPTTAAPTTPTSTVPAGQEYKVEDAGSVTIKASDSGVFVDTVVANPGWEWSAEQSSPTEIHITMTNPDKTYEVYATLAADGTVDVRVDQPVVNVVRVPAPDNGGGSGGGGGGNTSNQAVAPQAPTNVAADDNNYEDDDYDDDDDDDDDDRYEEEDDDHYEDESDDDEVDEPDEEDDHHEDVEDEEDHDDEGSEDDD